jgi:hypothetical protein
MIRTTQTIACDRCKTERAETKDGDYCSMQTPEGWAHFVVYSPKMRSHYFCSECWPHVKIIPQSPGGFVWSTPEPKLRPNQCDIRPLTPGYAPCTRNKGHDGPCANPLNFNTDRP